MASIAYLGNSATSQRNSFVDPLHSKLTVQWNQEMELRRAGLGGVGSLAVAGLLDYLVLRHDVDVCFVECSLADSGGATPMQLIHLAVESILKDLIRSSVTPIVLHLPRHDVSAAQSESVIEIYNALATKHQVQVIDLRNSGDSDSFNDGVHATAEFSAEIAHKIAAALPAPPHISESLGDAKEAGKAKFIHAYLGEIATGKATHSRFRMALPTLVMKQGSEIQFAIKGKCIAGIYLIANSHSGVLNLKAGSEDITVQIWDQWCHRPRIQFVSLYPMLTQELTLTLSATNLAFADRNCVGNATPEIHRGTQVELLGLCSIEDSRAFSEENQLHDQVWWNAGV